MAMRVYGHASSAGGEPPKFQLTQAAKGRLIQAVCTTASQFGGCAVVPDQTSFVLSAVDSKLKDGLPTCVPPGDVRVTVQVVLNCAPGVFKSLLRLRGQVNFHKGPDVDFTGALPPPPAARARAAVGAARSQASARGSTGLAGTGVVNNGRSRGPPADFGVRGMEVDPDAGAPVLHASKTGVTGSTGVTGITGSMGSTGEMEVDSAVPQGVGDMVVHGAVPQGVGDMVVYGAVPQGNVVVYGPVAHSNVWAVDPNPNHTFSKFFGVAPASPRARTQWPTPGGPLQDAVQPRPLPADDGVPPEGSATLEEATATIREMEARMAATYAFQRDGRRKSGARLLNEASEKKELLDLLRLCASDDRSGWEQRKLEQLAPAKTAYEKVAAHLAESVAYNDKVCDTLRTADKEEKRVREEVARGKEKVAVLGTTMSKMQAELLALEEMAASRGL